MTRCCQRLAPWLGIVIAIVLIGVAQGTTFTVGPSGAYDYTKIQDAVNAASEGDTIIVNDGNYSENVDVGTAHLTIESANGSASTTVQALNSDDHVFEVTADYVNISGFAVNGATERMRAGIYLSGADHCTISGNTASSNYCGIVLDFSSNNNISGNTASSNGHGIRLVSSSNNNIISGNTASSNVCGIDLFNSSNNNISGNTASSNDDFGIFLGDSSNNMLSGNTASSNDDFGISLDSSSNNNMLSGNTASLNDYGILLGSSSDNTISGNTASSNGCGILLDSSSDNTISDNTASSNVNYGIYLVDSSNNNIISGNTASSNDGYGIYLADFSNYNTISGNTASSNDYGIYLKMYSSNNLIYNNSFNNAKNAYDDGSNYWNTTKTPGTNIIGGPWIGGNCWSDYAGRDRTGDGLGDTDLPYNSNDGIANGGDLHPLIYFSLKRPGSPLNVTKAANKETVKRGDEITYTITVCNTGGPPESDVIVWDVFDRYVEFVWSSHARDGDGRWHLGTLGPGECVTITLVVKVPKQELEYSSDLGVTGEGFVNVASDYSTTLQSYAIRNIVYARLADATEDVSASESVTVLGEPGTELSTREHGSGLYETEEDIRMLTENKSISMEKDVTADYKPTTLGLYRNRSITYDTKWIEKARAKNRITGTSMYEAYHYAAHLDRNSYIKLDKNGSTMAVDSKFDGQGHIGILKKSHPNATARDTPLFESREDYTGSFRIYEKVDEYGTGVVSDKSTTGTGLVAMNKRVKDSQKTYESGTGTYDSEELIRTHSNYIAKDISLVHEPMNKSLTDDVSINASLKWKEGMVSKNPKTSLIGEEYTSIERLEKETMALGLNQMDTEAEFRGRAEYRAILRDEVDLDESYAGDYSIKRRVLFQGIPKYDHPHLNVTKVLVGIAREKAGTKEVILAGEDMDKIINVATYEIIVENDGDRALHPIYVRDIFPPGAKYIDASARPAELTSTSANWTLTHLSIGDVATITLRLDVTEYQGDELVNRAEACGEYNGDMICGTNFSALEVDWLTCCLNETVHVTKTVQVDENATNVVIYTLTIQNLEDCTRVAQVIDLLPEGMKLLDASLPIASYVNDTVTWNLIDIMPFETKKIVYRTEALRSGTFVNEARVDVRSVDGTSFRPVYVSAEVTIGEFEDEKQAPGWQPPDWGFDSGCEECNELTS